MQNQPRHPDVTVTEPQAKVSAEAHGLGQPQGAEWQWWQKQMGAGPQENPSRLKKYIYLLKNPMQTSQLSVTSLSSSCTEALLPALPAGWLQEQRRSLRCKKPVLSLAAEQNYHWYTHWYAQHLELNHNLALCCYSQSYCCFPPSIAAFIFIFFESNTQN